MRAEYFQLPPVAWGEVAVTPHPPAPGPPSVSPLNGGRNSQNEGGASAAKSAIENELAQWERFALNRLDKSEQTRPFEVTSVPDERWLSRSAPG